MKVVFLEDVPGTANIGEIKDVKPGFARNYLLPRRLAMPATPAVVRSAEQRAAREARLQEARDNEARTLADKIGAAQITVTAKAGPAGKLFGSVGANEIAEKVAGITGSEFDRHNVLLPEAIKELGDYEVNLRLTRNVQATAKLSVIGEDGTTMADIRARQEQETQPEQPAEQPVAAEEPVETAEEPAESAEEEEAAEE